MVELHVSELDRFIEVVHAKGGDFRHPDIAAQFLPLHLTFDTRVDQALSPYSAEYYDQQIALYREIAGRELDQHEGELHPIDQSSLVNAPNPLGLRDACTTSEHVRTLATMLSLCALPGQPKVLDMGAGHGLSSELFAFSDCRVHAVDIDPGLGAVSRERARVRNLDIVRSELNFDDVDVLENNLYDAAFFFQSLHHCLKPWELIAKLKTKLKADGIIGFAGEPMQDIWWRNWGLRLDEESLFVARTLGWFESGWSRDFIRDCFERCGMTLTFFSGGLLGGEIAIGTMQDSRKDAVLQRASVLGLSQIGRDQRIVVQDNQYHSLAGLRADIFGRPGYRQSDGRQGVLVFGPYVDVCAGLFEFSMFGRCRSNGVLSSSSIEVDVVSEGGVETHWKEIRPAEIFTEGRLIVGRIDLPEPVRRLEVRASVIGDCDWQVSLPNIERLS